MLKIDSCNRCDGEEINHTQNENHQSNISQIIRNDCRKNQIVLICKPNKEAGILSLHIDEFVTKMNSILNDETKFPSMSNGKDRLITQSRNLYQRYFSASNHSDLIDFTASERVRLTVMSNPRWYGLRKLHEQRVSLRCILNMSNSRCHGLATVWNVPFILRTAQST